MWLWRKHCKWPTTQSLSHVMTSRNSIAPSWTGSRGSPAAAKDMRANGNITKCTRKPAPACASTEINMLRLCVSMGISRENIGRATPTLPDELHLPEQRQRLMLLRADRQPKSDGKPH